MIGLILTLISKDKANEAYKKRLLETQKKQEETLNNLNKQKEEHSIKSIADEIEKLKKLKENNSITEEEFKKLKKT